MHGERHRRPGPEGYGGLPESRLRRYLAGRQQITREWFVLRADGYELFILELVATEASGGDEPAVKDRVAFLEGIPRLRTTDAAVSRQGASSRPELCPGRPRRMPSTLRSRRCLA